MKADHPSTNRVVARATFTGADADVLRAAATLVGAKPGELVYTWARSHIASLRDDPEVQRLLAAQDARRRVAVARAEQEAALPGRKVKHLRVLDGEAQASG